MKGKERWKLYSVNKVTNQKWVSRSIGLELHQGSGYLCSKVATADKVRGAYEDVLTALSQGELKSKLKTLEIILVLPAAWLLLPFFGASNSDENEQAMKLLWDINNPEPGHSVYEYQLKLLFPYAAEINQNPTDICVHVFCNFLSQFLSLVNCKLETKRIDFLLRLIGLKGKILQIFFLLQ
ncbi:hypothetical protein V6N12_006789 [Hibiscus sabdariffa]|uniref:Uncharacterized protein n=1 Tax=Hibiscus sabdariffa TaxID=183260 RepID=A0ABR2EZX3_9ROSI